MVGDCAQGFQDEWTCYNAEIEDVSFDGEDVSVTVHIYRSGDSLIVTDGDLNLFVAGQLVDSRSGIAPMEAGPTGRGSTYTLTGSASEGNNIQVDFRSPNWSQLETLSMFSTVPQAPGLSLNEAVSRAIDNLEPVPVNVSLDVDMHGELGVEPGDTVTLVAEVTVEELDIQSAVESISEPIEPSVQDVVSEVESTLTIQDGGPVPGIDVKFDREGEVATFGYEPTDSNGVATKDILLQDAWAGEDITFMATSQAGDV